MQLVTPFALALNALGLSAGVTLVRAEDRRGRSLGRLGTPSASVRGVRQGPPKGRPAPSAARIGLSRLGYSSLSED